MKYTHLTADERYQIADLKGQGFSQEAIGQELNRSASTISRELNRNMVDEKWLPGSAHKQAQSRLRSRAINNVKRVDAEVILHAEQQLIRKQWSPEQISERLKLEGKKSLSHSWLYKHIKRNKRQGGSLYQHLRSKKIRRRRYGSKSKGKPKIANRIGIEERPAIVDTRSRLGDWEGDTIIGVRSQGTIVTLIDRMSRKVKLARVESKKPQPVTRVIIEKLTSSKALNHTLTVDNGGEFAGHLEVSKALKISVYFAQPYKSCQRGTNENTNGLVRQYLPKGRPLDNVTEKELQQIEDKLNNRPRRCLGYKTPNEVFFELIKKQKIALRC